MNAPAGGRARTIGELAIWGFAFGYFASYVPYSALTKALSKGLLGGMKVSDFELLPVSVLASVIGMFTFISAMRWWKYAGRREIFGATLPCPNRWTLLSGVATAAVIATTTLAYTFQGISIVFAMLLMRGGLLIMAPVVDAIARRHVRWFSWMGFVLSLASLFVAFSNKGGYTLTLLATIDIAVYLFAYFIRLRFMSRLAKSQDPSANIRYFVEEQMIASPLLLLLLGAGALLDPGTMGTNLRTGFTAFWSSPVLLPMILVGIFSQGTGIFGGLILLQKQENTFCVPVNRCSSVLAGVCASFALTILLGQAAPSSRELLGAGFIITAILFLTIPTLMRRREKIASGGASGARLGEAR
ncbi:MAG: hypothetical protein ACKVU1_15785 [bacterium]